MNYGDDRILFLIKDDEILFHSSVLTSHEMWARDELGLKRAKFKKMVHGFCLKEGKGWEVITHLEGDAPDGGRCVAEVNKFAPQIMKKCKTKHLKVFAGNDYYNLDSKKVN
ncbi:MAG: hypothetical protein LBG88_00230 [Christensenellaceae bacterium]|jgi:hypothetical protein|nr:hypothetical protein [Christensenellaceae bacterium]